MARDYSGKNTLQALMTIVKTELSKLLPASKVNATLTSTDDTEVLAASQGKALKGLMDAQGEASAKAIEDAIAGIGDGTTEVGNAAKLGGNDPDYYAVAEETETALNGKISSTEKGAASGVAPLNAAGVVDSQYLPSYVDDIVEMAHPEDDEDKWVLVDPETGAVTATEVTFERGKIYVDVASNMSYRWGGTALVPVTSSDLVEVTADEIQAMWDATVVPVEGGEEEEA